MGRLFWKFFFASWLVTLMAGVGSGTFVWWLHEKRAAAEPTVDIRGPGETLVGAARVLLERAGVDGLKAAMTRWSHTPGPQLLAVDEAGHELLDRPVAADVLAEAERLAGQDQGVPAVGRVEGDDGHRYLLFVPHHHHPHQALLSPLAMAQPGGLPPNHGPPRQHDSGPALWLPIITGVLASLVLSGWLAAYLAEPIRNLRSAFAQLAQGDLTTRVTGKMGDRRDELADLGQHFDEMAGHIETLVGAQRRLLHHVSHELRSPLARLQAAVGLVRQQPEEVGTLMDRIEREAQRLSDLVGELLALSRLENGIATDQEESFDLADVLSEVCEDARFEAQAKGISVELDIPETLPWAGLPGVLQRAFDNIVRNAVQHSPPETTVNIRGTWDDAKQKFTLSVEDCGRGVPPTDLKAIFEPFFRCDPIGKPESVGLGLTIARLAAEAHRGQIHAANRPQGGLRVSLTLPKPPR